MDFGKARHLKDCLLLKGGKRPLSKESKSLLRYRQERFENMLELMYKTYRLGFFFAVCKV